MKKRTHFMRIGLMLLCLTLGMLATAQPASAATLAVCKVGPCAYHSITDAVAAAASGDKITVAEGTYTEHDITITKNLTIVGAHPSLVTVNAGKSGRIFYIGISATVSISGMALTNGEVVGGEGGGIDNHGDLNLNDMIVTHNTADSGGGIHSAGTLTMTNGQVRYNSSTTVGSGFFLDYGTTTHLTHVLISYNTTTNGANGAGIAVYSNSNHTSTLVIDQVTVDHNTGSLDGSGIYAAGNLVTVTITNSTISNNSAHRGVGLYTTVSSTLNMTNDTVTGNVANSDGGGLQVDGNTTLTNVTVAGNSASNGGGIKIDVAGTVNLANTILAGNTASSSDPDCDGTLTSQDYNLIQDTTGCTINGTKNHNITWQSADLGALADNSGPTQTMALLTGSPAIDAGNNSTCASTDQRGVARPQGAHCDIGAFELDKTPPDTSIDSQNPATTPTNSTSMTFSFSGSDTDGSGVKSFQCELDGGGFAACGSPKIYTSLADGAHTFQVRAIDVDGNVDASPASYAWTVDTIAPTVVSSILADPNPTHAANVDFTVTFSEAVTGVDTSDFNLQTNGISGASVTNVSGSGASRTVTVNTGTGNGNLRLEVPASATSITDLAGNPIANLPYNSGDYYTIDKTKTPPTVVSSLLASPNPTNAASVDFTVTFSEAVKGVDAFGFTCTTTGAISGVYISGVSGSGTTYTVTVSTGTGNGTLRLDVPASATITDLAGNPIANLPYTGGEMYTIIKTRTTFLPVILR